MDVYRAGKPGYRKKMRRGRDRKKFSRTANRTRKENISSSPMRLGIRL